MSLNNPKFSIVIPLYNKEASIGNTIRSVLEQSFKDYELLIIDDGSTDKSVEQAATFSDERIKIFKKKNGGVSEARNYGIAHAISENIALLDADDSWLPELLEEMNTLIEKFPACGLYSAAYKKILLGKKWLYGNHLPEGIIENFFKTKLECLVPWTSATVIKKSAVQRVGGFPVGMIGGEDDFTWAKIATHYSVAFTPKVLAIYNTELTTTSKRYGRIDTCKESWFDFYKEGDFYRNEFVAKKALDKGIRYAYSQDNLKAKCIEQQTKYTKLFKKKWYNLYLLNRLPKRGLLLLKKFLPGFKRMKSFASSFRKAIPAYLKRDHKFYAPNSF